MKYESDFARLSSVLQSDKSVMSESCKALVLRDFSEKFGEYFEVNGLPRMELSYKNGKYFVKIEFEAERIKTFRVVK